MIETPFGTTKLPVVQGQTLQERILIVNESTELIGSLKAAFCLYHWQVISTHSAAEALHILDKAKHPNPFSLVLLDMTLPDQDGFTLGQQLLQNFSPLALIFLTQRNDLELKVRAMLMGADDYLVLPVELAEVVARVERSLRLRRQTNTACFRHQALEVDYIQGRVRIHGIDVPFSIQEYRFMSCLTRTFGQVVSCLELAEHLWPEGFIGNEEDLVKKVKLRVQAKLDRVAPTIKLIHSVPGCGYYLEWRPVSSLEKMGGEISR